MKLYEFTVTDKNKFSKEELDMVVQSVLQTESVQQKWQLGYECDQVKVESLANGELKYHFQVTGQFEDFGANDDSERNPDTNLKPESIAARPAEL